MAAVDQIKNLIRSFGDSDDSRFYATAMQIAADEARKGHRELADELKNLINTSKKAKSDSGIVRKIPVTNAQKELKDLLELSRPEDKLKDMVLTDDLKQSIERILKEQREVEKLRQHNLFPRKKILLTGPPGCGKTMTAKVLSNELGIPLFVIRLDGLISRYMGESIAKLRLIFDAMEDFRAVYLFDEFDSIGTTRNQGNEVGEIKRVLNTFLLQIEKDNSNSIIVAATNLPESLDLALFRRFDDLISYPLPTEKQIFGFYKKELSKFSSLKILDLKMIAKKSVGMNFSDLKMITQDYFKYILLDQGSKVDSKFVIKSIESRNQIF